jgi:hypothetical protein
VIVSDEKRRDFDGLSINEKKGCLDWLFGIVVPE